MSDNEFDPATLRSVLEEYFRELGKEIGSQEIELAADYHAAELSAKLRDQLNEDMVVLDLPSMGSPPNAMEKVLNSALKVLASWSYGEQNPHDGTAGWAAEANEDYLLEDIIELIRWRGHLVFDGVPIEVQDAIFEVERGDDREYAWALGLADALRNWLGEALPPTERIRVGKSGVEPTHEVVKQWTFNPPTTEELERMQQFFEKRSD